MRTRKPVELVRAGQSFIAVSTPSLERLAKLRSFLALPDAVDPNTFDDDLITALMNVITVNCRFYTEWLHMPPSLLPPIVPAATGGSLFVTANSPMKQAAPPNSVALATAPSSTAVAVAPITDSGNASSAYYCTFGTTTWPFTGTVNGGEPMCSEATVTAGTATCSMDGPFRRNIALVKNQLLYPCGVHRCSIKILQAPVATTDDDTPHCLFGICSGQTAINDFTDAGHAASAQWAAMQWSVGMTVPMGPTLAAVSVTGKPVVQAVASMKAFYIQVGDVVTAELKPSGVPSMVPAAGERSIATATPIDPATGDAAMQLSFYVNGVLMLTLKDAQRFQPMARGSHAVSAAPSILPHGTSKPTKLATATGAEGCHFGVLLSRGVSVAVLSP